MAYGSRGRVHFGGSGITIAEKQEAERSHIDCIWKAMGRGKAITPWRLIPVTSLYHTLPPNSFITLPNNSTSSGPRAQMHEHVCNRLSSKPPQAVSCFPAPFSNTWAGESGAFKSYKVNAAHGNQQEANDLRVRAFSKIMMVAQK